MVTPYWETPFEGFLWGEDFLPPSSGTEHFMVAGSSGSGKSSLIQMLLASVFHPLDPEAKTRRAIIYDPKQDILPRLFGMGLGSRVKVLHPFDERSHAWDIARDIDNPLSARQAATILIPSSEDATAGSFFTDAARDLLTGVMLTFINCSPSPPEWTFRDLILAMLYEPYLRDVLSRQVDRDGNPFPLTKRLSETYLDSDDPRTISNIRSTINSKLAVYEPVAAAWSQRDTKTFSLKDWVATPGQILVMGNDEASRAAIDPINQVIFKRAVELTLARPEILDFDSKKGTNQTWFFFDEVREAGKLDGLRQLMNKGRSKGACVVLGFQDIEGLRDVYGEQVANELTAQCQNIALLQMNSPQTAQWAVDMFGKFLNRQKLSSTSTDKEGGIERSRNVTEDERSVVYTSMLIFLPKAGKEKGLHGIFRSPYRDLDTEGFRVSIAWEGGVQAYRPPEHPDAHKLDSEGRQGPYAAFIPRPYSHFYLSPWNAEDWSRLGWDARPLPVWFKVTRIPPGPPPVNIPSEKLEKRTDIKPSGGLP